MPDLSAVIYKNNVTVILTELLSRAVILECILRGMLT